MSESALAAEAGAGGGAGEESGAAAADRDSVLEAADLALVQAQLSDDNAAVLAALDRVAALPPSRRTAAVLGTEVLHLRSQHARRDGTPPADPAAAAVWNRTCAIVAAWERGVTAEVEAAEQAEGLVLPQRRGPAPKRKRCRQVPRGGRETGHAECRAA
jgi:hypothetical protein